MASLRQGHIHYEKQELGEPITAAIIAATTVGKMIYDSSKPKDIDCSQKRQDIEKKIEKYLTAEDRRSLVSGMEDRVAPTAEDMAYFYTGEEDCKHKNVAKRHERFINELPQLLNQRMREAEKQIVPAKLSTITGDINEQLVYGIGGLMLALGGYYGFRKYKQANT